MQLTNTWTALKTDKKKTTNWSDQKMGHSSITWPDDVAVYIHYKQYSPQWAAAAKCSWRREYLNTNHWNFRFHVANTIVRTPFSEGMTNVIDTSYWYTHQTSISPQYSSNAANTEIASSTSDTHAHLNLANTMVCIALTACMRSMSYGSVTACMHKTSHSSHWATWAELQWT
jgi:hypothetical protein